MRPRTTDLLENIVAKMQELATERDQLAERSKRGRIEGNLVKSSVAEALAAGVGATRTPGCGAAARSRRCLVPVAVRVAAAWPSGRW